MMIFDLNISLQSKMKLTLKFSTEILFRFCVSIYNGSTSVNYFDINVVS